MASNGYPKITAKAWRALRARAAAAPSTKFTPATVATLMGMASPDSARDNTVTPMRKLGLIDDDGALTPRGNKWRVDASYPDACQEILDEVYPPDLSALADGSGAPDPQLIKTWFDHKGFGGSNSRQMAATYVMIARKDVSAAVSTEPRKASTRMAPARQAPAKKAPVPSSPTPADPSANSAPESSEENASGGPNVHLDIQIHIPADASVEQIDQIFESMARHLYKQ